MLKQLFYKFFEVIKRLVIGNTINRSTDAITRLTLYDIRLFCSHSHSVLMIGCYCRIIYLWPVRIVWGETWHESGGCVIGSALCAHSDVRGSDNICNKIMWRNQTLNIYLLLYYWAFSWPLVWKTELYVTSSTYDWFGRAIARPVSYKLPTAAARVRSQVGFVVDKVTLGQVLSEHFDFPCQLSFHECSLLICHPGLVQYASWCPTYQVNLMSPHSTKLKKSIYIYAFHCPGIGLCNYTDLKSKGTLLLTANHNIHTVVLKEI
jgi:hypothetical protein